MQFWQTYRDFVSKSRKSSRSDSEIDFEMSTFSSENLIMKCFVWTLEMQFVHFWQSGHEIFVSDSYFFNKSPKTKKKWEKTFKKIIFSQNVALDT